MADRKHRKGSQNTYLAKQLIDCTGNALIASMAGYNVLREKETQPGSLVYIWLRF